MRPPMLFLMLLAACAPAGPGAGTRGLGNCAWRVCVRSVNHTLRPSLSGRKSGASTCHDRADLPVPRKPTPRRGSSNRASGACAIDSNLGPHELDRSTGIGPPEGYARH